MENAEFAVIVPVYNRAITVLDALDSIAAQSLLPHKVVVVDDGSTDATEQSVNGWVNQSAIADRCLVIRQENAGASAARNRGIAEVGSLPFVAFLDSDDLWPTDYLERVAARLAAHEDAVAATCDERYAYYNEEDRELFGDLTDRDLSPLEEDATNWLVCNDGGITPATVFSTAALASVNGFDESLLTGEDWAMMLRVSLLGRWLHVPGEAVTVRRGIARERGEETHLGERLADSNIIWARILEDFIDNAGGHEVVDRQLYTRVLAKRWYRAGRRMVKAGHIKESRICFRCSSRWRTINKAWLRLAQTYLPRAA